MVKFIYLTLITYLLNYTLIAQDIAIEASIDQNQGFVGHPLSGSITLTHPRHIKIDPSLFSLNQHPLKAIFSKEVNISQGDQGTIISIYHFELPAEERGLHTLDPITIKVGGISYQSTSSSYTVSDETKVSKPLQDNHTPSTPSYSYNPGESLLLNTWFGRGHSTKSPSTPSRSSPSNRNFVNVTPKHSTKSAGQIIFHLDSFAKTPTPFYPGQRAELIYRITYNRSVDLSFSDFPLLYAIDFIKIGDEKVVDYEKGSLTYQDIVQEIEASKAGHFYYGPSFIEGYAYTINQMNQKIYQSSKLIAEAPPVEVVVTPFPLEHQPASFNGSLGKLDIHIKMLTSSKISIGDQIEIKVLVGKNTNLTNFKFPNLKCQPGFSGFFQLDDLPPLTNIYEDTKEFNIRLRPLSSFIKEVPSIEISSFDPEKKQYLTWHSLPIPLTFSSSIISSPTLLSPAPFFDLKTLIDQWVQAPKNFTQVDIPNNTISFSDLRTSLLQTWWTIGIIPFGILVLTFEKKVHQKWLAKIQQKKVPKSQELIEKALYSPLLKKEELLQGVENAFMQALDEHYHFKNKEEDLNYISNEEIIVDVKNFLSHLHSLKYGPDKEMALEPFKQQARDLFSKLKSYAKINK